MDGGAGEHASVALAVCIKDTAQQALRRDPRGDARQEGLQTLHEVEASASVLGEAFNQVQGRNIN
jgi:hypothetical protein